MSKLKLDLHDIFNKNNLIEQSLNNIIAQAAAGHIDEIEIIPGKGSGVLKERAIRFLNDKKIKKLYSRYKVDNKNFGRIFVYFNWNKLIK